MFLKSFKGRIIFLLIAVLILFSVILFFISSAIIKASLEAEEISLLRSRLLEFYALYQSGNLDLLQKETTLENLYQDDRAYVVRIAGRDNKTRFLYLPPHWKTFPLDLLETVPPTLEGEPFSLKNPQTKEELIFLTLALPDQNLLQIGLSSQQKEKILKQFQSIFLFTLLPLLLITITTSTWLVRRFLKPVNNLIEVTRRISQTGKIEERIPDLKAGDELAELSSLYNQMLNRIENLINSMRESLNQVAHDLRTPLTRLRVVAETALASNAKSSSLKQALQSCLKEAGRLLELINNLLELSRIEEGIIKLNLEKIELSSLVRDLTDFYQYLAEEKKIHLDFLETEKGLYVEADKNRLRQALANLIDNALKYTPAGKSVRLDLFKKDKEAVLEITDEGAGIKPEDLPYIFTRFYRGSNSLKETGFGLGLYLAKKIIEAHIGNLEVSFKALGGSTFKIRLPLA